MAAILIYFRSIAQYVRTSDWSSGGRGTIIITKFGSVFSANWGSLVARTSTMIDERIQYLTLVRQHNRDTTLITCLGCGVE